MGSIRFEGVSFRAYPDDHEPRHVHGFYAEVEVVVDLLPGGMVALSRRRSKVRPSKASASDVQHILNVAARHVSELVALWEKNHA